jgi:hypothetical protein
MAGLDAGWVGQGMVADGWQPQAAEAMTVAWFREQKLDTLTARYAQLHQWRKPPDK